MIRYALAPLRGLALAVLAVLGFLAGGVLIVAAALVVTYPTGIVLSRRPANLGRRLSGRWAGVPIAVPYRPGPAPVATRRPDGWYEHDNQLYKHAWGPNFMLRLKWLSDDPATQRDWWWLMICGPIGGVLALLAPALMVVGVLLAPLGLALVPAGVLLGPITLRLYGMWTRQWLQPAEKSWWHLSGVSRWVRDSGLAAWRALALFGLSLVGAAVLAVLALATMIAGGFGIGIVGEAARPFLNSYRRLASKWGGREIAEPYRPRPGAPEPDPDGRYREGRRLHDTPEAAVRGQRWSWLLGDPATWRDIVWMATAPFIGLLTLLPAVGIGYGFFGLAWQPLWWPLWGLPAWLVGDVWLTPWFMWDLTLTFLPEAAGVPAWLSPFIGLVAGLLGALLARPVLRLLSWWDAWLLGPTEASRLAQRVQRLTETRADAVDVQAAELRRIERDLHDGAQARLVAVGLSLAAIERLMERDPDSARLLLAQARETSATALGELRDLVRGIHPPVLAERGLGDAVRAVALDSPLQVEVTVDLPGRVEPPVESAAYFAVTECLANASRHASHVRIDIRHTGTLLRITVADDGPGGADPAKGSGLRGIRRRLGTFDGVLTPHSPPGGPTVMTMEIPCALSSPRTSSC